MHQQRKSDLIRVLFSLDVDEDEWPPASAETMWAKVLSPDRVEIDNVPFFVRGLSSGDEVRVVRDDDGMPVATDVIEWAGFEEGWWDYEEGNVSERWRSAG
ncbi:DUF4265 domain-containing protein [Actinoplanes sp. HUAS TT8]|uniref:DUF4265 domain-containing protein n=1 Tax=Actinoplanes sp. HUAS TT8 TaxID=3447453 RepID=UPI003F5204BC